MIVSKEFCHFFREPEAIFIIGAQLVSCICQCGVLTDAGQDVVDLTLFWHQVMDIPGGDHGQCQVFCQVDQSLCQPQFTGIVMPLQLNVNMLGFKVVDEPLSGMPRLVISFLRYP